jgi:hypothetical protein
VVKDHNSKTAVVLREGRKYIFLVAMKSGRLTVTKLTHKQFERAGFVTLVTDVKEVIDRYLSHVAGLTDTAIRELEGAKKCLKQS